MFVRCAAVDNLNVRYTSDYVWDVLFQYVNKMHDALNGEAAEKHKYCVTQ